MYYILYNKNKVNIIKNELCRNFFFCVLLLLIDISFVASISILENNYLENRTSSTKLILTLVIYIGIILFLLLLLCFRYTILSIIVTVIYSIIGFGFFLFTFIIEIIDLIKPEENKFKKEYLNDHINFVIMTLTILTILIRIICIFFMKSYYEILEKQDNFLRSEAQDKFIQDLENKIENNNERWSIKNNNSNEKKNKKKKTKNNTEIEDNNSYLNEN
jgi:23S rRNA maturation mini-RNase III